MEANCTSKEHPSQSAALPASHPTSRGLVSSPRGKRIEMETENSTPEPSTPHYDSDTTPPCNSPEYFSRPLPTYNFPNYEVLAVEDEVIQSPALLAQIFTPRASSSDYKQFELPSNEILEWEGDSILSTCATRFIQEEFPHVVELEVKDRISQSLVSNDTLYRMARDMGWHHRVIIGPAAIGFQSSTYRKTLADLIEAYLGGLVRSEGYPGVYNVAYGWLYDKFKRISASAYDTATKSYYQKNQGIKEAKEAKAAKKREYKVDQHDKVHKRHVEAVGVAMRVNRIGRLLEMHYQSKRGERCFLTAKVCI